MTDPRIEAAARALCIASRNDPDDLVWITTEPGVQEPYGSRWTARYHEAEEALAAADAAEGVHVVRFPIPDERMQIAKDTLHCWKAGALSDGDAIGMIVCGVSAPPTGGGNG